MFEVEEVRELYTAIAGRYDRLARLYPLLGARTGRYRRAAVDGLGLVPGEAVVELGCGTGLNLPLLVEAVGPTGRVVGVDLTPAMLEEARDRIRAEGWENVELVASDVADYPLPPGVDGILSTFALTLSPAYDRVVARAAEALAPDGRLAILDLKRPEGWPEWLVRLGVRLNRPFGVTLELAERHPWESVREHLEEVAYREFYFGALYLSVGRPPR